MFLVIIITFQKTRFDFWESKFTNHAQFLVEKIVHKNLDKSYCTMIIS